MTKFNNDTAEALYELSLEGGHDEEIGSVDELGWFGLFEEEGTILEEDSQGFVHAHTYLDAYAVRLNWAAIENAYENYYNEEVA